MEGAHAGAPRGRGRRYARVAEQTPAYEELSREDIFKRISELEEQMYRHARDLEFEQAAKIRDEIRDLQEAGVPDKAAAGK